MPAAIPLIAGIASVGAGIAAGATTLVGGLMIASGAMSAVGGLTGNKTLTKLGGVVGLAGGVAGLATGAWTSGAQQAATEASAASVAQPLSETTGSMAENVAGSLSGVNPLAQTGSAGGGLVQGASQAANAVSSPIQPLVDTASTTPSPMNWTSDAQDASQAAQFASPQPGIVGAAARNGSMTTGVGQWVRDNKELVNLGAGLIGGGMKALSDQELAKTQAELQDEMLRKRQARYSDSIKNLQAPTYVPPPR